MGFRSAWALLSVSVSLGFIVGCATQATDAPGGGSSGDTSTPGGTGGSTGASAGASGGGSTSAGASGTLGSSGGGGTNSAGASGSSAAGSAGASGGAASGGAAGASGAGGASGSAGANGGAGAAGTSGAAGASTGGAGGSSAGAGGHAGAGGASGGTGGVSGGAGTSGSGGSGASGGVLGKSYILNQFVVGSSAASATVNVTWNSTKIEFVFNVQDATPEDDSTVNWQDDAAEIYLDLNNGKTGAFQADDCQIVIPRLTGTVDGVGSASYSAISVVRTSVGSTGYMLDVSIPWTALPISPAPLGQTIGINLAVDDDTDGGDRDAQLMLSGTDQAYDNPSTWASLLLN